MIITVIAIALVAIAVVATTYYGSTSWTGGNSQAKATTILNQREQIRTASALYKANEDSAGPENMGELVTAKLMTDTPELDEQAWQMSGTLLFLQLPNDEAGEAICSKVYEELNGEAPDPNDLNIPSCEDNVDDDGGRRVCCTG